MSNVLSFPQAACNRALRRLDKCAPHLAGALALVRDGRLGLHLEFQREVAPPLRLGHQAGPLLAIIADDDVCAMGPLGFDHARVVPLIAAARWSVIVAIPPEHDVYTQAAGGACRTGACVLIETAPDQLPAWLSVLNANLPPDAPTVCCLPRPSALLAAASRPLH